MTRTISLVRSLSYNFILFGFFKHIKEEPEESDGPDEPDIPLSLIYISNKWWEV